MSQSSNADRMQVWRDFLATYSRVMAALEEDLQSQSNLPLNWFDVLVQLSEAPDTRLRMQDLASFVMMTRSGLTRRIDRMVEAGLVRREPVPGDRRSAYTALTEEGFQKLLSVVPGHRDRVEQYFRSHLSEQDAEVMRHAFGRMLSAVDSARRTDSG